MIPALVIYHLILRGKIFILVLNILYLRYELNKIMTKEFFKEMDTEEDS